MSDLISRQAAIDAISCDITITGRQNAELVAQTIGRFADRIKALPSAQPERKRGKWNTYYHGDNKFSYSCNQCGYSAPYQMIGGEVFQKKWNFCPNCGTDMTEDEDGRSR